MASPGDEYEEIFGARVGRDAAAALAPRRLELASRYGPVAVDLWPAATNVRPELLPPAAGHALGHAEDWRPALGAALPLAGLADPLGLIAARAPLCPRPAGLVDLPVEAVAWHNTRLRGVAAEDPARAAYCNMCGAGVGRGVAFGAGAALGGVPALKHAAAFCLGCYWRDLRPLGAAEGPAAFIGVGPGSCVHLLCEPRDDDPTWVRVYVDAAGKTALVVGIDNEVAAAPASLGDRLAGVERVYRCP